MMARAIVYVAAAVAASLCTGQEAAPIRVDVKLVNVSFTARDAAGKLTPDLTREDIEVLEDGAVQSVAYFARAGEAPLTVGLAADVSGSQEQFLKRHSHDLEMFLRRVVQPRDQTFLLAFGNHLRLLADLTASPDEVLAGLRGKSGRAPEIGPREVRVLGTAFYDALYYATELKLAAAEGHRRKALIVFSDGEDNSSAHHMLDVIESAERENVAIFGVRYTEAKHGEYTARNKYGASVMKRISADTGGADFDASADDLGRAFQEIGDELRSSYELGYYANQHGAAGFHKIAIRAKREGLRIRAKAGYFGAG